MMKLADKLAELSQRALDLQSQIALHGQRAAFLGEHGQSRKAADEAVAMQKRLTSLRRSCQILARHVAQPARTVS